MPFRELSVVEQREEFCRLIEAGGVGSRELCRRFGISPTTGRKWLLRWQAEGRSGLSDRSRRPRRSPSRTEAELEAAVLACRRDHPAWGGRKIRRVLLDDGLTGVPAASTVTAILRRHGLLDGPGAGEPRAWLRFESEAPNDLWQMDFKGHVPFGAGRLHPLTVIDDCSRFALVLSACANQQEETVRDRLRGAFRTYGMPWRILCDNGSPWGSAGGSAGGSGGGSAGGELTALEVWLMDMNIRMIHGRPYHPQTQGKDERFHRTLKTELLAGRTFATLAEAEAAFAAWKSIYNRRRPHEALGLQVPASRYQASPRPFPETVDPPEYEPGTPVRKVGKGNTIGFEGRKFTCPQALRGKNVALRATETDGVYDLCYRHHILSRIDLRQNEVKPVHHVPEHRSTMSPV